MEIVAVDIGGTHARFALAQIQGRQVQSLSEVTTLKAAEHASFQLAWEAYANLLCRPLPSCAAIAIACPVQGEVLKLTNNPWVIRPSLFRAKLGLERYVLINDFGAVGHAVAQVSPEYLCHVCGPARALPHEGAISIVGPGTGLGVAMLLKREGKAHVVQTEGGHVDFAALDPLEDDILRRLRLRYRRVSAERIISGPGLSDLYEVLAAIEGTAVHAEDNKTLWSAAIEGSNKLAAAALDRFCLSLGAFAGDTALAHGASGVVLAGGVGSRLASVLPRSGFAGRFVAKGRFERMMDDIPVKLITYPQPGLFGAAAAYAEAHAES